MNLRRIVLLLLTAGAVYSSRAQQYTFLSYSVKEGLAQSQVRCLFQDTRGYLWAGTLDGLSRFDGRVFRNYYSVDGLFSNQVNCIEELPDGRILTGNNGGITMIDAVSMRSYALPEKWKETPVNALWPLNNGQVLIGTEDGVFVLDKGVVSEAGFDHHIKSFRLTPEGVLLVLARDGLYEYSGNTFSEIFVPHPDNAFFDLEISDGQWWLAAKDCGLYVSPVGGKDFKAVSATAGLTITGICVGEDHALWLASRFGFYKYSSGSLLRFSEKNGLQTPDVRDVLVDGDGVLWLGTYGAGLIRFTGEQFRSYTKADGLSSDAVMTITEDDSGHIWLGTFDGGLCEQDSTGFVIHTLEEFTGNNRIWCSQKSRSGDLWFGSSNGLFQYSAGKFTQYSVADSLADRVVLSLLEDTNGDLWIGTAEGITLRTSTGLHPFRTNTGLDHVRVRHMAQDRAGDLWFATNDGVYRYTGGRIEHFTEAEGLPDNGTYSVEIDPYNQLWVATQEGLARFTSREFQPVALEGQSGSRAINFLRYDHGSLWIGTNAGLFRMEDHEGVSASAVQRFAVEDGLRGMETNLNAAFIDTNGRFWFGTTEGAMRYDEKSDRAKRGRRQPQILIERIQLNLQQVDWSKFGAIDSLTGLPLNLETDYKNNHFTFYFTGFSFAYPDDIRYQYMLEGFDEDWKALTRDQLATYSNLPYSSFVFKVRAFSKEGTWSDAAVFPFRVRPPFWLTWWFVLLEIVTIGGIMWTIYSSRRKALHERHEKEKYALQSRLLSLEQQSLNSSMNRHFIFNALNSIQYYINRQDRLAANRYLSEFAKLIRKNLDSSEHNLTSLREEIERLELYLSLENMRFRDKFSYFIHVDDSIDQDSIKVPAMLLQPFLENSIWHGILPKQAPGRVDVSVDRIGESIEITITDDGIGIDLSRQGKNGTEGHISKGMEITSGRIDLIRKMTGQPVQLVGPYQLHNSAGQPSGTQVRIVLPVNFHELFSD